jgi:hypothetical protein
MKVYPSDASVIPHPSRRPRKFHVGIGEKIWSNSVILYGACDDKQSLDENSGIESRDLPLTSLCQRQACRTAREAD